MSDSISQIKTDNQTSGLKEIFQDEVKLSRLLLLISGVILIFVGITLSRNSSQDNSSQNNIIIAGEVTSFSQEPVSIDKKLLQTNDKQKDKLPPVRIVIPSVNIDLPVKEAKVVKGYWEVFPDRAGFGLGSTYPGEIGNQVIFAHARTGLFLPLKKVKIKDKIFVSTKTKLFTYQVTTIKEVYPNNTDIIGMTDEKTLTLYTCTGFSDSKRLIVAAKEMII